MTEAQQEKDKLKNYAFRLLGIRPRSLKEAEAKLSRYAIRKGIPREIILPVLEELKSAGFLDDKEFTSWWVGQRSEVNPKGMRLILQELKQKGISQELIESVISDQSQKPNEQQKAIRILQKKKWLWQGKNKLETKIKISRILSSRGFDWDIINNCIDELLQKD